MDFGGLYVRTIRQSTVCGAAGTKGKPSFFVAASSSSFFLLGGCRRFVVVPEAGITSYAIEERKRKNKKSESMTSRSRREKWRGWFFNFPIKIFSFPSSNRERERFSLGRSRVLKAEAFFECPPVGRSASYLLMEGARKKVSQWLHLEIFVRSKLIILEKKIEGKKRVFFSIWHTNLDLSSLYFYSPIRSHSFGMTISIECSTEFLLLHSMTFRDVRYWKFSYDNDKDDIYLNIAITIRYDILDLENLTTNVHFPWSKVFCCWE